MPDFRVIDGGEGRGLEGFDAMYAVQCFEDLAIELLRDARLLSLCTIRGGQNRSPLGPLEAFPPGGKGLKKDESR